MSILTSRSQKIEDRKSILEARAAQTSQPVLGLAKKEIDTWNHVFTGVSIVGPIFIAFLYLLLPISFSNFVWWYLLIDCTFTIGLILALLFVLSKLNIALEVARKIETSKSCQQAQIVALEKHIKSLKSNQTFYISATQLLGKAMKRGETDLESLSKVLIAAIYHNLSRVANDDDITVNLYELRNRRIRMIISANRLQYCDRESINNPFLYCNPTGIDINDENIQEYYCIQCIRGKVRGIGDKFIISDWKTIVEKFKWNKWTSEEKREIIQNNDRNRCIELGFKYNQYFAFMIRRDDGTIVYFEILANGETTLASADDLPSVTHKLMETYSPLLSILWDISDVSVEKECL